MDGELLKFKTRCHAHGWKCTRQRYAVYRVIQNNAGHPSADEVCMSLKETYPDLSRDSVYRILNDLAAAGIIGRMNFTEPVRFDGNPARHDHFFCCECGAIQDFNTALNACMLTGNWGRIHTFEVRATGLCEKCLKKLEE